MKSKYILMIGISFMLGGCVFLLFNTYLLSNSKFQKSKAQNGKANQDEASFDDYGSSMWGRPTDNPLPGAKYDYSNQQLKKVPPEIFNMSILEGLNLSNNRLTGIFPKEIGNLYFLKELNLSNNLITAIPPEINRCRDLEILNLSNNRLSSLPQEIGKLKKLKELNISGNNYSTEDLDAIMHALPDIKIIK
jgi:Leucine-rich repeat (LRR) protein